MATDRPVLIAEILGRRVPRSPRVVSPEDFSTGAWAPVDERRDLSKFVPYCLDMAERRSYYVKAGSAEAIARAPFQYLHLRERATQVASVPWERGSLHRRNAPGAIFLFSIGRCGSTLLTEMLRAGGLVSLSEPDFYTQAVTTYLLDLRADRERALGAVLQQMTHDLLALFSAPLEQRGIVKLRSECCAAPNLVIARQGPLPATMFLIRAFETWAASMLRATVLTPQRLVDRYLQGLRCLRWLLDNSNCRLIRYEDLLANPENVLGEAATHLSVTLERHRLKTVLNRDAQIGSPLAREKMRGQESRGLAEALALWSSAEPSALLRSVGLGSSV